MLLSVAVAMSALAPDCHAQTVGRLSGRVLSTISQPAGDPVPGVIVRVPELGLFTETDDRGRFDFTAFPTGRYEVRAEVLGCQLGSGMVQIGRGDAATLDFRVDRPVIAIQGLVARPLPSDPSDFEVPYAVGRLDPTRLERNPGRTIADLIRGEFPGAKIVQGSGLAGTEISIQLRGRRSIGTEQVPLIVIDGAITGGGAIDLNPLDVRDISVLKGSVAAAHYGARGQAGVIEITTGRAVRRARAKEGPAVILDGAVTPGGLEDVDPAEIGSMELMGGDVARLLFGPVAPEAGVVRVRTRGSTQGRLNSCFEPAGTAH